MDFFKVFISHTSRIRKPLGELKVFLEGYGVSCFVAHDDIQVSEEWRDRIEDEIRTADAFVPILTKDFSSSEWTDQEIGIAMGEGVSIFPISIDNVQPYGFIGKFQSYSPSRNGVTGDPEQWSSVSVTCFGINLFELLLNSQKSHDRMIEAMVTRIETAVSYTHTNNLIPYLSKISKLPALFVDRLDEAYKANSQVREAFKATHKLPEMIERWRSDSK